MKKKFIYFIVFIIVIVLVSRHIYYDEKKEKILVSGKVFGFNIENVYSKEENDGKGVLPTSLQKIGTITFIKPNSNSFAALGHPVSELNKKKDILGECYGIDIDEIRKANKEKPGKIVAALDGEQKIGNLESTNNYGIFGKVYQEEKEALIEMETSSRYEINRGYAEIFINLDGKMVKKYEVEIISLDYLSSNRNIKLKVKSEELINLAGGIVQGMSGAPIVQNDKLIGALNYVSIYDPTEAYGIFIDKLI